MSLTVSRLFIALILFIASANAVKAQAGLCPSNLDFEQGDFSGWVCEAGIVDGAGNIIMSVTPPLVGRHTLIPTATAGVDPYGGFPQNCPNGSGFSVRLGNSGGGHQAEGMSYTYTIPATLTTFSMLFNYAVVFQDPFHQPWEQPRFRARITDLTTNLPIPCVDFDFIASSSLPGFLPSPAGGGVWYKDWTPITVNLNAFIGRTIKLEFITNDCTFTAHFGYAYIDVNTNCNGAITGTTLCPGVNAVTLTAPFGFQSYEWWADNGFSSIISTSQTLTLNPAPPVGTIFPVVVTPYSGFGCKDTLYATIGSIASNPVSDAGPNVSGCAQLQVPIGAASTPSYSYLWTPASLLNNPTISNPLALTPSSPTEFIVQTTDILTGCMSYDTTIVSGTFVDTAMAQTGLATYCQGNPAAGSLTVSNSGVASVQWYNGTTPIPGATGLSFQPAVSGDYWAQVQQSGCTDSTRTVTFAVNPVPVSDAGLDGTACINETIQIGAAPNPAYNYSWTPAANLSSAIIANPFASFTNATPVEFIVHTTDAATGCNSYDTTIISVRAADTAIVLSGKNHYCLGDPGAGTLAVHNVVSGVQWYNGSTAIPGATGFTYFPTLPGDYWAQVQQSGCTDSTRTIDFDLNAVPTALFTASSDTGCVTNNSFVFTNGSGITDGSALSYVWKLSDGTTQTIVDAVKTFSVKGTYTVKLITISEFGCIDSTSNYIVHVLPNAQTAFKWDSICVNRPVQFYNQTNTNGSVQVNYSWNFNDGNPPLLQQDPPPLIYSTQGTIDVVLLATALGCENDPDSVIHKVQVNKPATGTRYRDITVPQGSSQYIHVRGDVGNIYNWRPALQLSSYSTRYTEFTAVNDVHYLIDITDRHTCVTTDTLQMLVLKKPGFYLPTAFTPNGDGMNDIAKPYLVGMKSLKSFSVFNRWGERMFYSTTYGQGWNGKYKGADQNAGVYVWILEFYNADNKLVTEKGTIAIVR